jgi:hypothetical protein
MNYSSLLYKDKIERIAIYLNLENAYWRWRPRRALLWGLIVYQEEGFYHNFAFPALAANPLEDKNLRVEGNKVYYKPYILIRSVSGEKETIYFNTKGELFDFIKKEELLSIPHIKIIE